eukprot:gene7655-5206_t
MERCLESILRPLRNPQGRLDPDFILAFRTPKKVDIQDRRLGILYYSVMLAMPTGMVQNYLRQPLFGREGIDDDTWAKEIITQLTLPYPHFGNAYDFPYCLQSGL